MNVSRTHMEERHDRGFTLMEVLVALAILALVAGGSLSLISQTTRFIAAAEDQAAASALADNTLVRRLISRQPLDLGEEVSEVEFAGRNWLVTETIAETGAGGLVRVDVAVRAAGAEQVLARASTLRRG